MCKQSEDATGGGAGAQVRTDEIKLAHSQRAIKRGNWRQSRWLAVVELLIVVMIFVADHRYHVVPVSKTPFLLLLGWISLRLRKIRWSTIGFRRNTSWSKTAAIGLGAGLILETFQLLVTQPLLVQLTRKQPDLSDLQALRGSIAYTLIAVALSWTLAAFGEELVWRGYLMNRVADLGRHTRLAWVCAFLAVNTAFGFSHADQGLTGQIEEAIAGLFLAVMYLTSGKSLAIPIIAHGASDTLDMVLLFLGKYPGT